MKNEIERIAVLDAEGIVYIIGYDNAGIQDEEYVMSKVDEFLNSIFMSVKADSYIGILGAITEEGEVSKNFRMSIAKQKQYKGNRTKPEWYHVWCRKIEHYMIHKWGFLRSEPDVEADDVVSSIHAHFMKMPKCLPILCENDKDLGQMFGHHYNFKKNESSIITPNEAQFNLFSQVLIGDSTDNIPGLKGVGKVGAKAILDAEDAFAGNYHLVTLYEYTKKLGLDQGIQQFYENYMLVKMREDLDPNPYILSGLQTYDPHKFVLDTLSKGFTSPKTPPTLIASDDELNSLFKIN